MKATVYQTNYKIPPKYENRANNFDTIVLWIIFSKKFEKLRRKWKWNMVSPVLRK